MALAIESIGQLIISISLFGTGMALGIFGILLAIARSTTKNQSHWALIFSAFAWAIALVIPNIWFSGMIFGMGAVAITISFMPLLEKMGDGNIFALAIIAGIINLLLIIGSGAYGASLAWQENMDSSTADIENLLEGNIDKLGSATPTTKLCKPNEIEEDGEPCKSDAVSGSFNENLFVPFASVLTIGTYIGKAISFIGMVILAPLIIGQKIASSGYFVNTIILALMGFLVIAWEMAIFYKLIAFILGKRGMK